MKLTPLGGAIILLLGCEQVANLTTVLSNSSACGEGGGTRFVPAIRSFFERHGIQYAARFDGDIGFVIEGHRAPATFTVIYSGHHGTIALRVDEGSQASERDRKDYHELGSVFDPCEPTEVNGKHVGRADAEQVPVLREDP